MLFTRKQIVSLTYLSQRSEFQGNINVEGNLRIDGIIHGTVEVQGDIEVSPTGLVEGPEIHAHNLIIHGVVKGRIIASGRLTLARTARLEGDVTANAIDMEAGAFYIGHITTTADSRVLPGSKDFPELIAQDS